MDALKEHGHEIVYIADDSFNDYEYVGIYKKLASCDCLLAFADKWTLSGTWRLTEITHAIYGWGAFEENTNSGFHIPVFVYKGLRRLSYEHRKRTCSGIFVYAGKIRLRMWPRVV